MVRQVESFPEVDAETAPTRTWTCESVALAYDANGNLLNDGEQNYRYDAQNRLIAVESTGGASKPVRAEF